MKIPVKPSHKRLLRSRLRGFVWITLNLMLRYEHSSHGYHNLFKIDGRVLLISQNTVAGKLASILYRVNIVSHMLVR
eukprot:scaffold15243_cov434-Alexandrium_tamarense.AAC.1